MLSYVKSFFTSKQNENQSQTVNDGASSDLTSTLYLDDESFIDSDDDKPFVPQSRILLQKRLIRTEPSSDSSDSDEEKIQIVYGYLTLDDESPKPSSATEKKEENIKSNITFVETEKVHFENSNLSSTFFNDEKSFIKEFPEHHGYIEFTPIADKSKKINNSISDMNKYEKAVKTKKDDFESNFFMTPSNKQNVLSPRSRSVKFGPRKPASENNLGPLTVPRKPILRKQSDSPKSSPTQILDTDFNFQPPIDPTNEIENANSLPLQNKADFIEEEDSCQVVYFSSLKA